MKYENRRTKICAEHRGEAGGEEAAHLQHQARHPQHAQIRKSVRSSRPPQIHIDQHVNVIHSQNTQIHKHE